jgi:hypothetical protein
LLRRPLQALARWRIQQASSTRIPQQLVLVLVLAFLALLQGLWYEG